MVGHVPRDDVPDLTEALRLARRELKFARGEQEFAVETLQRVRRQRAALREQVRSFSEDLAALLSEHYWAEVRPRSGLLGRRQQRSGALSHEQQMVAEVEASELFDGGWYLRHNPEAAKARISPALHYVRTGGRLGREPGPRFDTVGYLRENPEARVTGVPPLIHHLRRDSTQAGH